MSVVPASSGWRRQAPARRAAIAAALLVAAAGCGFSGDPIGDERARYDFTMKDMHGAEVDFASFKGRPLVINFWATWCGPCRVETPQLERLYAKYRARGLTIVGIETDADSEETRKFAEAYKVTYPMLIGRDRRDVQIAFSWTGTLPTSVLIRVDGTIAARAEGLHTDAWWERQIEALF